MWIVIRMLRYIKDGAEGAPFLVLRILYYAKARVEKVYFLAPFLIGRYIPTP
jgi:hypothetical protein